MQLWKLLIICVAGLSCDRRTSAPAPPPPIHMAAAAYAVADIAREVGGKDVQLRWVLEKPAILAQYQPTDVDRQRLLGADLLIVSGSIDAWVLENQGTLQRERGIIRLNLLPGTIESGGSATWLDPNAGAALAEELPRLFYSRRPERRQTYVDASNRWKDELARIRSQFEPQLANASGKKVGTLSPTFDAILLRYNLAPVRLADAQPHQLSDLQLLQLKQTAAAQGIGWLAVDASIPDSLVQWLGGRTGLKPLRLETLGSSASTSAVGTYLGICRYNLQELCRLTGE